VIIHKGDDNLKKLIKRLFLVLFLVASCLYISPTKINAETSTDSTTLKQFSVDLEDSIVFNVRYDASLSEAYLSASIKNYEYHYYTAIAFNKLDEINDFASFDSINYKYKYCKTGMNLIPGVSSTHVCFKKTWSKEKVVYAEDIQEIRELKSTGNLLNPYKVESIGTINHIGEVSTLMDMGIAFDIKYKEIDLSDYDYYFLMTKKFTYEDLIIKVNYIDNDGNYNEAPCVGSGCYHDYGTAPTNIEDLLKEIWTFLKDYGPLILLFVIAFLVGIWVTPLMNLITGVIKMVIKILDYAWTTIVNACIGVHNIWFWLWTRDDYKRKQKMKSYRKYN